ncbi:hypothetical protein FOZ60_012232 [Perkinsus olseni]|uniref:Uncharacterized protein n=1 Tax=Perkinsus olseni TaxID=32597 RepID=A0A7J6NBV3_PEROL|nr:hypothetical protein FOZ60_012232 [Perkinsus olseni]
MAHGGEPGPLLEFLGLDSVEALHYLTPVDLDEHLRAQDASPAMKAAMRRLFQLHCKPFCTSTSSTTSLSRPPQAPLPASVGAQNPSLLLTYDLSLSGTDHVPANTPTTFLAAYCGRTDDRPPYLHKHNPASSTPQPSTSPSPTTMVCVADSAHAAPSPADCTVRSPAFGSSRLVIDTGCSHSLLSHDAALHLQRHIGNRSTTLALDPVATPCSRYAGLSPCPTTTLPHPTHDPYGYCDDNAYDTLPVPIHDDYDTD